MAESSIRKEAMTNIFQMLKSKCCLSTSVAIKLTKDTTLIILQARHTFRPQNTHQ